MAWVDVFNDWLHDQITVQKTTRNSFGERVVSSTAAYTGRVRYVDKIIRTSTGEEKQIHHIVYLPYNPPISLDDFLVLPDGGRREIIQIKREEDEDGSIDHLEIAM